MSCVPQFKYITGQPLLACALLSSLAWYLFWVVMAPVKRDIAHIFNWYFFMKFKLDQLYDVYGTLGRVHHWAPLLVISVIILAKVSPLLSGFLSKLAQVTFVVVVLYNTSLFLYLLTAGGKVTTLFFLALPLRLVLSLGPWITALLLPHKLFIPLSLLMTAHLICSCLCQWQTEPRSKIGPNRPSARVWHRLLVTVGPLLLTLSVGWWIMYRGCAPCASHYSTDTPPPPPRLIAHRGCGENSPENSLAAFEHAVQIPQIHGLETDVQISSDGTPFLLHDPHLVRTTDVREKCPPINPWINASALSFSAGECPLGKLNVGSWYNKAKVDQSQESFAHQNLPVFSDYLWIAKRSGKVIIFDIMEPPVGHAHHSRYLNITLEAIVDSGILLSKVWWLPKQNRAWVIQNHPEITHITKTTETPFEDFESERIVRVNDDWTTPIHKFRAYQAANISINMYFVDSPFMYNYAWCLGVQTTTTDNCEELASLTSNHLYQVCRDWQRDLHQPSTLSWCTGLTLLFLLLLVLILWDKLLIWK